MPVLSWVHPLLLLPARLQAPVYRLLFCGWFGGASLERCRRDGAFEYLDVQWAPKDNYDPWDDSWEPEKYIITKGLIDAYKSARSRCPRR